MQASSADLQAIARSGYFSSAEGVRGACVRSRAAAAETVEERCIMDSDASGLLYTKCHDCMIWNRNVISGKHLADS